MFDEGFRGYNSFFLKVMFYILRQDFFEVMILPINQISLSAKVLKVMFKIIEILR